MSRRAHRDAGFTLVEVLVSLAIFSLAIVGLNRAGGLAVRGTAELDQRIHAGFVADNAVVQLKMRPVEAGTDRRAARSGGYDFDVVSETAATELPDFYQIDVRVRREDAEQVIASRRAFRHDARAAPAVPQTPAEDAP